MQLEILRLFVSPGHNFFGHHGRAPGEHATVEVDAIECVAGRGLRGDRFFDYKEDYKGQISFFASEVYNDLCARFQVSGVSPAVFRRNALTRGVDLNTLIGQKFEVQGVQFEGVCECTACYWMDQAFHPGALEALKNRGGLRARILTDGWLHTTRKEVADHV
ncbi:MAG: molybdenum cofactor biosysynthesis protein [Verrucomicrobia bacterium]|nr:molybdenum cofactor biosysynthesis protein [Verrucomicrobiota bacterium]